MQEKSWAYANKPQGIQAETCACGQGKFIRTKNIDRCIICLHKKNHDIQHKPRTELVIN